MASMWTILRRSLVLTGLLLGLAIVGSLIFLHTEQFRSLARQHILNALNTSLAGQVSLERLEGSLWGSLVLHQLRLEYQGETLLHIPRLTARYRLLPLLDGRLEVSDLSLVEPLVRISQNAQGRLDLLEAVSQGAEGESESSSSLGIGLENLTIENGQLSLSRGDHAYRLNEVRLDARLDTRPTGLDLRIRHLSLHALAQGFPPLGVEAAARYQHGSARPVVQLHRLSLTTDHSRLQLTGRLSNVDAPQTDLGLDIELSLEKLGLADVLRFAPGLPLTHDLSGQVRLSGRPSELHATGQLKTAGATVDVQATADLSQQPPRYQGTLRLAQVDPARLLADDRLGDVQALIHGSLRGRGVGTAVSALEVEADLRVERLRLAEAELGSIAVQARLANQTATLDGELSGALGHASWQGRLALAETPAYSLSFAADQLDPAAAGYDTLGGDLKLHGSLHGTGLGLSNMDARAELTLQPSRLGPVNLTRGRLIARIADGRLHVSEAMLLTPDARLHIAGELGTAIDHSGRLSYSLRLDRLSPWLALAGREGSGRLRLEGTAEGSLGNVRARGKLRAEAVRLAELSLAAATIDFAAERLGQPQPQASLSIGLSDLHAGLGLQTLSAELQLAPGPSETDQPGHQLHLDLTASQTPERRHRLRARILAQSERVTAQLQELSVALPLGTWQLARPARLGYRAGSLTLDSFVLAKHEQPEQQLILRGRLAITGTQGLQLQLTNCSLDEFTALLPQQPRLHGTLSAEVQIGGTAEAPSIAASASVREARIAGQAYAGAKATVRYQDRKARLQLVFHQDERHALYADGSLPVALGWAEGFRAAVFGDLDVAIRSDGLDLAVLNAFSGGAADDIAGTLRLDLRATGPTDTPQLSGSFDLEDGRATVKALGLDVSPISLSASLSPGHLRITRLTAQAGDGSLSGAGLIRLAQYWPQSLDLSFTANDWPALWTHQYRVAIDSQLKASGPFAAPHLSGHIELRQAALRPELSFLSAQPLHHDETIVVRPSADAPALADEQTPRPDQARTGDDSSPSLVDNLTLALALDLGHATRLQHQNADITLGGGLSVSKKRDEAPRLAGVMQLVRGWAGFQGRRFILNRGSVTFSKETRLNPRLDILAQYEHDDYVIDAVVGGTGEAPRLELRSTPPLEQADILAVLLFGKPTSALNKGEEIDLQQEAVALTSGYAAATLGQSVSDALGLDTLGIDLSDLDFSGGQVGFGRALTRKTRISASQSIGGKQGQEVAIDYEVTPNLDLRTSASSTGSSSADIIWRKRY